MHHASQTRHGNAADTQSARRFPIVATAAASTQVCALIELAIQLIVRNGFNIVAVEADWPDACGVNRWVRLRSDESDAD